jgi:hypothetical protein
MKFRLPLLIFSSAMLVATGTSAAGEGKQGHGAGGVRADHASEQGLEKGKAWAGSNEENEKQSKERKEKKEKKLKKEEKDMKPQG